MSLEILQIYHNGRFSFFFFQHMTIVYDLYVSSMWSPILDWTPTWLLAKKKWTPTSHMSRQDRNMCSKHRQIRGCIITWKEEKKKKTTSSLCPSITPTLQIWWLWNLKWQIAWFSIAEWMRQVAIRSNSQNCLWPWRCPPYGDIPYYFVVQMSWYKEQIEPTRILKMPNILLNLPPKKETNNKECIPTFDTPTPWTWKTI